jgi:hypothetical protein
MNYNLPDILEKIEKNHIEIRKNIDKQDRISKELHLYDNFYHMTQQKNMNKTLKNMFYYQIILKNFDNQINREDILEKYKYESHNFALQYVEMFISNLEYDLLTFDNFEEYDEENDDNYKVFEICTANFYWLTFNRDDLEQLFDTFETSVYWAKKYYDEIKKYNNNDNNDKYLDTLKNIMIYCLKVFKNYELIKSKNKYSNTFSQEQMKNIHTESMEIAKLFGACYGDMTMRSQKFTFNFILI